ncbi:hypothetical protein D3C72_709730 [compost metagenome]
MLDRIFQLKTFQAMRTALAALAILVLTVNGALGMGPIADEALSNDGPSSSLWATAYTRSALATDDLRRHRSVAQGHAAVLRPQVQSDPPTGARAAVAPSRPSGLVASAASVRAIRPGPAGYPDPGGPAAASPPGPLGSRAPPLIA